MSYVQFGKFLTQDDARSTESAFRLRPLVISGGSRIFQRETPVSLWRCAPTYYFATF